MTRNNSRSARNRFFARDTKNRQSPGPLVTSSAKLLIANLRLQWDNLIYKHIAKQPEHDGAFFYGWLPTIYYLVLDHQLQIKEGKMK